MRAAVLEAPGHLSVRDVALPAHGLAALVQVEQAGVCGTDRKVVAGAFPVALPRIIGHELIGRIVEPGEQTRGDAGDGEGWRPARGDRVLIDPSVSCGRCRSCRRGQPHLCPSGGLMGRDVDGGLAELVAADPSRLHLVPPTVGPDDAALLQVLGTCVHAQRRAAVFPTDPAVVVGLGVSGLLHVQLLRARGCPTVVGVGRSASKRALAESLGATATCVPDEALAVVGALTGGEGADLVIEAVGTPSTIALAVAVARGGGTVVVYGTAPSGSHPVPLYEMYRKELTLQNPRAATGADYDDAIELVANGSVGGAALVSDRLALEDAPGVLAGWDSGGDRLKVVFEPCA